MGVGAWQIYNRFKRNLGRAGVNLATATVRMALFTSASNAATLTLSSYGSLTSEVTQANGYTTGGGTHGLFTQSWTAGASAGQLRFNGNARVWSGSGGTVSNIKFAVLYASGASAGAKKLICVSQLSTAQFNLTINNTLTVTPAATGIFNMA